jgi:hypothetical protein
MSEVENVEEVLTWKSRVVKSRFVKGESGLDPERICVNGSGDPEGGGS